MSERRTATNASRTPLYRWIVTARADDETDAQVVAEVLAGAVRDERNDPAEPVDVTFEPADKAARDR